MKALKKSFQDLLHYPSAVIGLVMVLILVIVGIIAIISIPYQKAIELWRGSEADWYMNPKYAAPAWTNYFTAKKLSESISVSSRENPEYKVTELNSDGSAMINFSFPFEYEYDTFPTDIIIFFDSEYKEKAPFASVSLTTPDGRLIRMKNLTIPSHGSYRIDQDTNLKTKLKGVTPRIGLLAVPDSDPPAVLKGSYVVNIEAVTFEPETDITAEFISFGQLQGLAGTDHLRRDILIALLWGTPVALSFGLMAAVGTTLAQMIIAAISTWFGSWVDTIIQRITEINLVLPFLPILIMIGTFYSRTILTILGSVILLSIFGVGIKTFRAVFLQTKESPYIEAARAYGASNSRIIFSYLIPRIIPMLIPQFITQIPAYVFLEASLAVLGLGDPTLPTWGKVINDARENGALYQGWYYWVLEPSAMLIFTGLAFSMLGFALDRVFNPRLRGQ